MRLNLALILSIIVAGGLVAFGFTVFESSREKSKLEDELEKRTERVADDFFAKDLHFVSDKNPALIQQYTDSICSRYNLAGIALFYGADSVVALNAAAKILLPVSADYVSQSITSDSAFGNFTTGDNRKIYQYFRPVKGDGYSNSVVVFYVDAGYIANITNRIWFGNFLRWFIQALIISFITILILRWGILSPINKIVQRMKVARSGNVDQLEQKPTAHFLEPLHREIVHIAKAMQEAKAVAEEEARLRTNAEEIWTPERLKIEMGNLLHDKKLVVVSNREPYMHIHEGKSIKVIVPASGLITAMEPVLKACGGLWVASGTGDADREMVDVNDKVQVPPDAPDYTLRRLWLTKEEEDHFYYGFSNEGLWPLCHIAHTRPTFRKEDWFYYKKVNEYFASAVLDEIKDEKEPFILIQDYHFALLPELIKKKRRDAKVAIFWHIPWPNPESFGICPWQREILKGMLGADLVGFHTQYHCNNFLETVNNSLESRVIWENFSVRMSGQTTLVKPFPISIAFTMKDYDAENPVNNRAAALLGEHGITAEYMGVGVDRIDYTKGIIERFHAVERFLEKFPEYLGRFTLVQIGAPSRTLLKSYADLVNAVENEANRINWKFKSKNWKAIVFLKRHHSHDEILPYYMAANLCMVTSLHDGMNLVAKEFVASRNNNDGTLILSRFAGASQELHGAILVNPYDIEKTADAIKYALEMSPDNQHRRMLQMRQVIVKNNIYAWAAHLLRTMAGIQN